jgi:carboxypeptidase C (cathepsin A)
MKLTFGLGAILVFSTRVHLCRNLVRKFGYYDLATPFFEGIDEMHHLPIPENLQANISYHYYEAGHMVYANEAC